MLGQFLSYTLAMDELHPEHILYLAVPLDTFDDFFRLEFGQLAIQRYRLRRIVYDPERQEIVEWLD